MLWSLLYKEIVMNQISSFQLEHKEDSNQRKDLYTETLDVKSVYTWQ
jgi:hypothetical protein